MAYSGITAPSMTEITWLKYSFSCFEAVGVGFCRSAIGKVKQFSLKYVSGSSMVKEWLA